eukprot:GSChrysophyteH2.ASY1.ANO1.1173.1 assembled CDS
MGNIVASLLGLYCRSGCKSSVVASALTFHPPPPLYTFNPAPGDRDRGTTTSTSRSSSGNGSGSGSGSGNKGSSREKESHGSEDQLPLSSSTTSTTSAATAICSGHRCRLTFIEELEAHITPSMRQRCHAYMVTSSRGTFIPVMVWAAGRSSGTGGNSGNGGNAVKDAPRKHTILFSHGNAADLGAMFLFFDMLFQSVPVNIVAYDYTGYGASMDFGVNCTEEGTYDDIDSVYDWACDYQGGLLIPSGDPSRHLVLYGQSIGSGPSCYLASGSSYRLVLHSPVMSGLRVLTASRALACCDIYPNIQWIKTVTAPVFVIHGQKDVEVSFAHGNNLHNNVPSKYRTTPWWVPNRYVLSLSHSLFLSLLSTFTISQHLI